MADEDSITQRYVSDEAVFADICNFMVYDGEQKIKSEDLQEQDSTEISILETKGQKRKIRKLQRDLKKQVTIKSDGKMNYVIIGLENQSDVHYAMPVKNMNYDASNYSEQVDSKKKEYKREYKNIDKIQQENPERYKPNAGEFLTGFYKKDKLIPVLTLAVYFGEEEWDAPKSLHEMFPKLPERILNMIPDYKINLLNPHEISDQEMNKFQSSLREVFLFIKHAKDKEYLQKITANDFRFQEVDSTAVEVINEMTGANIEVKEGVKKINMCKGIEDMKKDAEEKGRREARREANRNLICKVVIKMRKSFSVSRIAEELEEPQQIIQTIYSIAQKYAPEYAVEKILKEMM